MRSHHASQKKFVPLFGQTKKSGINGILPIYTNHESLCITLKHLPQDLLQGKQIVQIGHWTNCKYVRPAFLTIGNPFSKKLNKYSIPNNCILIMTELICGSKRLVHVQKRADIYQVHDVRYKLRDDIFNYQVGAQKKEFVEGVCCGPVTFWQADDVVFCQLSSSENLLIAWHILLPFVLYNPPGLSSNWFSCHDQTYWNLLQADDEFMPKNSTESKWVREETCATCSLALNGWPQNADILSHVSKIQPELSCIEKPSHINDTSNQDVTDIIRVQSTQNPLPTKMNNSIHVVVSNDTCAIFVAMKQLQYILYDK
jgi:hypothetical protein